MELFSAVEKQKTLVQWDPAILNRLLARWTGTPKWISVLRGRGADSGKSRMKSVGTTFAAEVLDVAYAATVQESVWLGRIFAFAKKLSFLSEIVINIVNQDSIMTAKMTSEETVPSISISNII